MNQTVQTLVASIFYGPPERQPDNGYHRYII